MDSILVRADSSTDLGIGHIMRTMALTEQWTITEGVATFVTNSDQRMRSRLEASRMRVISLSCRPGSLTDAGEVVAISKRLRPKWIVLDGYEFQANYQRVLKEAGLKLLLIDDNAHCGHYYADIIVNQNIHADYNLYKDKCEQYTKLLLGTSYVLLRGEFLKYQDFKRQIAERATNLLVTLGGADPDNATSQVINALKLLNDPSIIVRIVIGPENRHKESLNKMVKCLPFKAELFINPGSMPDLMAWADFCISGGGSTCWELLFMGLPFVIIVTAENQKKIASGLHDKGVTINCGETHTIIPRNLRHIVSTLLNKREMRAAMSFEGRKLVNGMGSRTICAAMRRQNNESIDTY